MNNPGLSTVAKRASGQAISYLMQALFQHSDCISLAAGFVDESTLPTQLVIDSTQRILTQDADGRSKLQYGTTPGVESLRAIFRSHLSELENNPDINSLPLDRIVLTTGSQQLLCLLTQALFEPGDICLVAAPTYFVYLSVLEGTGAEVIPVPTDHKGMKPDGLESILRNLTDQGRRHRVKLVYAVSYYDNPSGISISGDRRQQLVQMVQKWSSPQQPLFLLEDAAYRELRYEGPVLPSLWSFDDSAETVILTQTFSKSFSPGLRVGFSVLPETLIKPVCDLKGNEDFGSSRFNQHLIADVLQSGSYAAHLKQVIAGYELKRNAMLSAAAEFFSDIPDVDWFRPSGGLYLWMTLSPKIRTGFDSRLFEYATQTAKVIYVPGELCYPTSWEGRPRNQMRLSFGVESPAAIRDGLRRLACAVRHVTDHS
ncbi:MAG: PLP-dependent aminotransferase family protein [Fuerstiella sp.]|nr:PLP-dependent aminotransferase family protein [Fuerstiella sp.]